MDVAFFGGSFNPPHVGHVLAASYALSLGFDKVVATVVNSHAFSKRLIAFEHRVAMARLAFEPLPDVLISEIEANLPAPNFTIHTLERLQAEHPEWRLRLLIGADVKTEFDQWHRAEDVRRIAPPLLLGRGGFESGELAVTLPTVSSTQARQELGACSPGKPASAWLCAHVPKRVLDYAITRGLYTD
jgi:nicotinate-nucleotide adenylyltransferase